MRKGSFPRRCPSVLRKIILSLFLVGKMFPETTRKQRPHQTVRNRVLVRQRKRETGEVSRWGSAGLGLRLQTFQVLGQWVFLDILLNVPAGQVGFQILLHYKVQGSLG